MRKAIGPMCNAALAVLALAVLVGCSPAPKVVAPAAAAAQAPKVVVVTFDGARWEDVFHGADAKMVEAYVHSDLRETVGKAYGGPQGGAGLMPFLHSVVARQGVLVGDRDAGQCAHVQNDMWFSYPGYAELLDGKPNPAILENDPIPNANVSFLEWAQNDKDFAGRVAMVGTWTLFKYIVNAERAKVPVNAALGDREPTDIRTAAEALDLLDTAKPRVLYVAFGDTDEFAHTGDYAGYLLALERGDEFLRQVWRRLQQDPFYRDQTTLIVSTDHGRGHTPMSAWMDHSSPRYHALYPKYQPQYNGKGVEGSQNIWVAAIGPAVRPEGAAAYGDGKTCALQAQIAASVVAALGRDPASFGKDVAPPFAFIRKP